MSMTPTRRGTWSEARNEEFVAMWNAGRTLEEIAQRFEVSRDAVSQRATRLRRSGLDLMRRRNQEPEEEAGQRRCLGCGRGFMSSHRGNRLCWSCASSEAMRGLA